MEDVFPRAGSLKSTMRTKLNTMFLRLYVKLEILLSCEEGQDLVEYALVVALIALGAVASMKTVATAISTEFSVIEKTFAASV